MSMDLSTIYNDDGRVCLELDKPVASSSSIQPTSSSLLSLHSTFSSKLLSSSYTHGW
jgi:hypothetical protein